MKNIKVYEAKKYQTESYVKTKDNIYKTYNNLIEQDIYVTSLSFEQEPEYDEGYNSCDISQYPLEDILDEYYVAVEDFYAELNDGSDNVCVLEFSSSEISDIEKLLGIVGKHVYNNEFEDNGRTYLKLVIE